MQYPLFLGILSSILSKSISRCFLNIHLKKINFIDSTPPFPVGRNLELASGSSQIFQAAIYMQDSRGANPPLLPPLFTDIIVVKSQIKAQLNREKNFDVSPQDIPLYL